MLNTKDMKRIIFIITLALFAQVTYAQHGGHYAATGEEKAFDGNDLVSYFESEKPEKGLEKYSYDYDGIHLLFSSDDNRTKFKNDPDKYIPAYNGWCAIALTGGSLVQPDFNEYKIQDGKLLFFEVKAFFNGKTAWDRDPDIHKIVADKKYTELMDKKD